MNIITIQMKGYINGWLETYRNNNTRHICMASVKQFLKTVYGSLIDDLESVAEKYVEECRSGRDWFRDLLSFAASLYDRPPASAMVYMSTVKNWIEYVLDVELTKRQTKLLRSRLPKGSRARTNEAELTSELLGRILTHCDVKGRALFLFLATSGIRIGEALQLRITDLDLTHEPVKVTIRGEYTKSGDGYNTFISEEAKKALVEWLKVRDEYIKSASGKGKGLTKTGFGRGLKREVDDRVFPFSMYVAMSMWNNAVRKAGLEDRDPSTNRRTLHIHMLRKWFQSQLKQAGVPEDVVEAFIGHRGYLDASYRRYTKEQLIEAYRKGESYLYISAPKDFHTIKSRFQSELEEAKRKIEDLTLKLMDSHTLVTKLFVERDEMERRVKQIEERIKNYEEFTEMFLQLTPDELTELGWEIYRRRGRRRDEVEELIELLDDRP